MRERYAHQSKKMVSPGVYGVANSDHQTSAIASESGQIVQYNESPRHNFKQTMSELQSAHLHNSEESTESKHKLSTVGSSIHASNSATNSISGNMTGLSNQGATCYMNSLLQTLYMTPEFRQGLYQWEYPYINISLPENSVAQPYNDSNHDSDDEVEEERENIPLQLQKLFAQLQTTSKTCVDTKSLTRSFGWTGNDVFQQHDVQELCRVFLDALEHSFKGTCKEDFVNELYRGTLKDYVKCCACGYESSRMDHFLDLSLVIRPIGMEDNAFSVRKIESLEKALEFFLKPEVLDKENQWECDKCELKRDAIKGLKFHRLPYLLSLQLKRFDFDYNTMDRIKLHDRVTFPKYLNMNSFLSNDEVKGEDANGDAEIDPIFGRKKGQLARRISLERHELEVMQRRKVNGCSGSQEHDGDGTHREQEKSNLSPVQDESDFEKESDDSNEDLLLDTWDPAFDVNMLFEEGPNVYELYSVLIHSGSALGGHYYAYIKNFENEKWYNFNDAHVTEITEDDVSGAFGGQSSSNGNRYGYRSNYTTCAYMLMYRLVSLSRNVNSVFKDEIPIYLKARIEQEESRFRDRERQVVERAKQTMIQVFVRSPDGRKVDKQILLYKDTTIDQALEILVDTFKKDAQSLALQGITLPESLELVRLRHYNDYNGIALHSYECRASKTLQEIGILEGHQLLLESKTVNEEWEMFDEEMLQVFAKRYIPQFAANESRILSRWIQIPQDSTVGFLYESVMKKFNLRDTNFRMLKRSYAAYSQHPITILNPDNSPQTMALKLEDKLYVASGTEVIVEECEDLEVPSEAAIFYEKEANMITVNVRYSTLPILAVRIDRRETARALKEEIEKRIHIPCDKFKLLRGANSAGIELKAIDSTLYKLSIGNNNTIHVVEGIPLGVGEYNCRLMLSSRAKETSSPLSKSTVILSELKLCLNDQDSTLLFVQNIVIGEGMRVEDVRQQVWNVFIEKNWVQPNCMTSQHIRLRDNRQGHLTGVLVDGYTLGELMSFSLYEGRSMIAEILESPEIESLPHQGVTLAVLDRSTWRFPHANAKKELIYHFSSTEEVSKTNDLADFLLKQSSSLLSIPSEFAQFARIPAFRQSINVLEAYAFQFTSAAQVATQIATSSDPEFLLVIDARVEPIVWSEDDRKAIQTSLHALETSTSSLPRLLKGPTEMIGYDSHLLKPREVALVIRTAKSKPNDYHRNVASGHTDPKIVSKASLSYCAMTMNRSASPCCMVSAFSTLHQGRKAHDRCIPKCRMNIKYQCCTKKSRLCVLHLDNSHGITDQWILLSLQIGLFLFGIILFCMQFGFLAVRPLSDGNESACLPSSFVFRDYTSEQVQGHDFEALSSTASRAFGPPRLQGSHRHACLDDYVARQLKGWQACLPISGRIDEPYCVAPDRLDLLVPKTSTTRCFGSVLHMLLVDTYEELKRMGGQPALLFGSLLGAFRNQSIIPYTEDADLGYQHTGAFDMFAFQHAMNRKGYHVFHQSIYRVCVAPDHPLAANLYDSKTQMDLPIRVIPYLDMYEMEKEGDSYWRIDQIKNRSRMVKNEQIEPFQRVVLNGVEYDTIADPLDFLVMEYGEDFMTPKPR
uniref:Uncharacterized protein AlNc14C38G3288 n=1 Tax=Albugo laibachii Nc14 TaxID=890382 RepID=F0W918_9STRA|nr:conserved hypothetical protein [Albugo laibachii Nc14]|eukprot:CCA17629.1 conserved hypothetical protein [Albugo laibachii Nc14]